MNTTFGHFRRNWLSWTAIFFLAIVFVNVRQIRNLFELPRLELETYWSIATAFYGFIGVLVLGYALAGWWVVPFDDKKLSHVSPGWQTGVRKFISAQQWKITCVTAGLATFLLVLSFIVNGSYAFDKSVLRLFSILLVVAATIVATWKILALESQRLLLRSLIALFMLNVFGEILWYLANEHRWFSPRNYSLWAILHIFFCVFLFARVVDVWQSYSQAPVRGIALVIVVIAAGWASTTTIGDIRNFSELEHNANVNLVVADQLLPPKVENEDIWLNWMQKRLKQIPDGDPVILIAASGGGSRAALFTSLVFDELDRYSITYGDGERKYYPADHVLMISSVSGGTLASTCYLDREYSKQRSNEGERSNLKNSIQSELAQLMSAELEKLTNLPWYRRMDPVSNTVVIDFVELASEKLKANGDPPLFRSPFVDDMCTDFMAPLLHGALHPGTDRSQSVTQFWQTRFGLHDTNISWLRRWQSGQMKSVPPLLLCNTCEVDRGSRLIIGFPPLPSGFLNHSSEQTVRAWVDLDPQKEKVVELSIADATRLSANFPWGFPVASIDIPQVDQSGQPSQAEVHLIDGGVRDNTGIDSLRYVIGALNTYSVLEETKTERQLHRKQVAGNILAELRERGVILLEIDSGAKPERPGAIARFLAGILEPVTALHNASYATATAAVRSHIDVLNSTLPNSQAESLTKRIERLRIRHSGNESIPDPSVLKIVNVKRLTITCNHQENVMTAWALGPSDKAQVFVRYLVGSERLQYEMQEYLNDFSVSRSALDILDSTVAELEAARTLDIERFNKVVTAHNDLVATSQAMENLATLRIGTEKMFYQGMPLPADLVQRVDEEIRFEPKLQIKLSKEIIPDVDGVEEPLPQPPVAKMTSNSTNVQYEMLYEAAQQIDSKVKQIRQETLERIDSLQSR